MATADDKKLMARIRKLEAGLRKLKARRKAEREGRQEQSKAPPGFSAVQSYGDRVLVPDAAEAEEREIEDVLRDD